MSTQVCRVRMKRDLAAEQRQHIAWGQIGERQRVNRSPRFSDEYQTVVAARFGGEAAKSSRDESLTCAPYLGLHQRSLSLGWFTPGYILSPLRGYFAALDLPGAMNRTCVDTNVRREDDVNPTHTTTLKPHDLPRMGTAK